MPGGRRRGQVLILGSATVSVKPPGVGAGSSVDVHVGNLNELDVFGECLLERGERVRAPRTCRR